MALAGVDSVNAYLAVAALIGIANAFEMPVRQTLIKDIVEERALVTSALGISAMVFNLGRMVGPAIAGVLLVYVSEAWCFVAQRAELRRHHRRAARHAPAARLRAGRDRRPARRASRASLAVLLSFPGRALPAADGGRHRPVRHALRAADAFDRRRTSSTGSPPPSAC